MVGSAPQSQSQPQPPPPPPSAEEEALKRNTDCVYFLASPLTCKKGSECEYRHSDVARVNPRDCYYWLHGNCLNTKCAFRHPPLDGLLGTQKPAAPTGSSTATLQTATAPTPHIPNNSAKQGAVCVFFQKGYCLKGDWCPFLHVPPSLINKASPAPGTSTAESGATIKKASSGLDKSVWERNSLPVNVAKPVKDLPRAKQTVEEAAPASLRNELAKNRRVPQTSGIPGYKRAPYASNGIQESWSDHVQQRQPFDEPESNSKDADELSREPSPGFDVLVDDENRESDYYPGDDRYGMSMEHDGGNEYDIDHITDYNMIAAVEDERYQDSLGYDSHERHKGQHPWDQHRGSSERMSGGSYLERSYDRADNLSQVDQFDLRHRLSKHKRSNGLRSVVNHEHARDQQVGDRNYQGFRRDEQHISVRENTHSSRLQGRITLPGADRNRISGRLSPVRTNIPSHQGSIRDRIKGRVNEAFNNGGKSHRGLHTRKDATSDNITDFAGPKSLAELKNKKNDDPVRQHATEHQSLGKRKHSIVGDHQHSENDLSFEGPKPLEEILKRKRGETIAPTNTEAENEGLDATKIEEPSSVYLQKTNGEESRQADPNSTIHSVSSKIETEDCVHPEDGVGQESEACDQRGGESDYEQQIGGEDPYAFDGENGDAAGEYIDDDDDDDDDDFAKKMGVMYT